MNQELMCLVTIITSADILLSVGRLKYYAVNGRTLLFYAPKMKDGLLVLVSIVVVVVTDDVLALRAKM